MQKFTAKDQEMARSYGFNVGVFFNNLIFSTDKDRNAGRYSISLEFREDCSSCSTWIKLPPGFSSFEEVLIHATLEELTAPP
jgi:hypothetical protein